MDCTHTPVRRRTYGIYTVLCKMIFWKMYAPPPEPVHKKQRKEKDTEGEKEKETAESEQARKKVINI